MNLISKYGLLILAVLILACQQKGDKEYPSEVKTDDGLSINFEASGNGDFTILFVHGWCINQTYWKSQVEALQENYEVITIDLPGHGQSDNNRSSWTVKQFGKDVISVINQLDLTNVVLVGHSMGGDVILEAGLMDNERIVALVGVDNFKDVGVTFDDQAREMVDAFMQSLKDDYVNVASAYAKNYLFHESTDSTVINRVVNDISQAYQPMAIGALEDLMDYPEIEPEMLSRLPQKFYFINSNATPTNTGSLMVTGVDFELLEIDATGHYPMIEKPLVFNQLLVQILEKIRSNQDAT